MKEFTIVMPFAGAISLIVEAENKDQAIEKFYDKASKVTFFDRGEMDNEEFEVVEFEFFEKMGSGNVRHYNYDRIDISENEIEVD